MKHFITLSVVAILFCACTSGGVVSDVADTYGLKDSLSKVFPNEKIHITMTNGEQIKIELKNSNLVDLRPEEREKISKEVGGIVRAFFDTSRIREGRLDFVEYKNYLVYEKEEIKYSYPFWEQIE